jgi:hypothetical protein
MSTFLAGWSEVDFTPQPGLPLLGQMHQRIATRARDALCAVALALQLGETSVVLVACDVCILDNAFVARTTRRCSEQTGVPAENILIHATHTHVAPISTGALMEPPLPEFEAVVEGAVLSAVNQAFDVMEPVDVFAGRGHLDQMGWNRRAMYEDGTSRMYGNSSDPGFIGMEGPRDGDLPVLWTRNKSGDITGILTGFATHPNCMEGECFYSADLPGAVRKHLRQSVGTSAKVLYLTGAAGNTAPSILDPFDSTQPWRGEAGVERSGAYFAEGAARVIARTHDPIEESTLALSTQTISIPLRPWPQPGEKTYADWPGIDYYRHSAKIWPQRLEECNPFPVTVHVVRIGDVAICTNPAELFVESGMEIKEGSPARVTFINQLTDGYCGYVPTAKAFSRGGYETWTAPSSQLSPEAGDEIVQTTRQLISKLWK